LLSLLGGLLVFAVGGGLVGFTAVLAVAAWDELVSRGRRG